MTTTPTGPEDPAPPHDPYADGRDGPVAVVDLPPFAIEPATPDDAAPADQSLSEDIADASAREDDPPAGAPSFMMSLGEHFAELRRRLLFCVSLFLPPFVAGMAAYSWLWESVVWPARRAAGFVGKNYEDLVSFRPEGPADVIFILARWDVMLVGIFLAPVWIYQAWMFLAPGLLADEQRAIRRIFGGGSLLFAAGAAMAYFYAVPLALAFLLPFNASLAGVENQWNINAYLDFLQAACIGFGVAFETPLAMWALARAGLLKTAFLKRYWRHTLMAVVVLSAVLTPPDPFTQILMILMLAALIGAGWKLAELGERQAARAAGTDDDP